MTRQIGPHDQVQSDIAALREATRQAHEAIKDLRALLKEAKEFETQMLKHLADGYTEIVQTAVEIGLVRYSEEINGHIETATQAVYSRFDLLTKMLLGETKEARKRYGTSIPELIGTIDEARALLNAEREEESDGDRV